MPSPRPRPPQPESLQRTARPALSSGRIVDRIVGRRGGRVGRVSGTIGIALILACLTACGSDSARQAAPGQESARIPGAASAERAISPSGQPYSEDRAACAERDPLRQPLWGELHVHSSLSMDAYMWDVRNGPDATYRFGKGETTFFPPLDEAGAPTRPTQLERPLDFVALTDHASFQGEVALCTQPGTATYESPSCRLFRADLEPGDTTVADFTARISTLSDALDARATKTRRAAKLCGEDGALCRSAMTSVWEEQQAAAERHYDRSSQCRFTTLHAYEYTATPGMAKVHHNVIFRNANVPASPIAWVDQPDVNRLWEELRDQCLDAGIECDVLTLPHNSNLSNGNMFAVTGKDLPLGEQRERARLRGDIERLAEINQIKGDSECRNNMFGVLGGTDEFCDFEEWRGPQLEDCEEGTGFGALFDSGCVSRLDYVRYALLEGFREQDRIGVNPYKMGIIAATDAHNANPGDVEEYSYEGWMGASDATAIDRLERGDSPVNATNSLAANPGGLAGVWAEENSRDSIFDAMKRKETFGTSGPRITARLFGGWDYPADLCGSSELVQEGYARGVPMGGDLPPVPAAAAESAPTFILSAMKDVGTEAHPGGLLQRAQIVKGWVDREGQFNQAVFDVAGGPNGAAVDPLTCTPIGRGQDDLCSVWTDPAFDPDLHAVYYARVLENPSCRWSARQCLSLPDGQRPSECEAPTMPKTIQERLWTSPIWYTAPDSAG